MASSSWLIYCPALNGNAVDRPYPLVWEATTARGTVTPNGAAKRIHYIQLSGPREGEFLAADEVRFRPIDDGDWN